MGSPACVLYEALQRQNPTAHVKPRLEIWTYRVSALTLGKKGKPAVMVWVVGILGYQ